jgi:hypothetical protein
MLFKQSTKRSTKKLGPATLLQHITAALVNHNKKTLISSAERKTNKT